jgi:hypothetical protein
MKTIPLYVAFLLLMGCRGVFEANLSNDKSRADLVLLCSVIHSGQVTEYKMVRSIFATKGVKMPCKAGDIVSSFTRDSSDTRRYDSVLLFYEMRDGKLHLFSEIAVYGDDVLAYEMSLSDVEDELKKP